MTILKFKYDRGSRIADRKKFSDCSIFLHIFMLLQVFAIKFTVDCLAFPYCNTMARNICVVDEAEIRNGNRTEWRTIQGVIGRVISNRPNA